MTAPPRHLIPAVLAWLLFLQSPALAASLVMDGRMDSRLSYTLTYRVQGASATRMLSLSVVEPQPYASLTTGQEVIDFSLHFTPQPDSQSRSTDNRGNTILTATWNAPPAEITQTYVLGTATRTVLQEVRSTVAFPPARPPLDVRVYLEPSAQVQSNSREIRELASELTSSARTSWDAVRQCIAWIVDNIQYVSTTKKYDALSTLASRKGNCQNFSHLAAALLRSVGIPVRIVNGITLDRPYDVQTTGLTFTSKMALGRHSWVEVWFPDLGWAPFDAQNSLLFVANRYLRCEIGVDNLDTDQDGRMAWIQREVAGSSPRLLEEHAASYLRDEVDLSGQLLDEGSRKLLRQPRIGLSLAAASPSPVPRPVQPESAPRPPGIQPPAPSVPEASSQRQPRIPVSLSAPATALPQPPGKTAVNTSEKPQPVSPDKQSKPAAPASPRTPHAAELPAKAKPTRFSRPYLAGNLDYPQDVDFSATRTAQRTGANTFQSTRTFLVESAQYVTTNLTQYAQLFQLDETLRLKSAGLALHRYGGGGQLWLELRSDDAGHPGKLLATSDILDLAGLSLRPGYRWADFSFTRDTPQLDPGDYWLVLGFTGDAVVNWFFSYGKPVGPGHGTRYKSALAREWSGALSYEFNYRIQGLAQAR
ncbi:MAG: transglutaminase domain-containing protein [Thermodesulfobacteriota bacterium]